MMKRTGTSVWAVAFVSAMALACSSTTSSGGSSGGPGAGGGDGGLFGGRSADGGAGAGEIVNIAEVEPNDGPGIAGAQDVGAFTTNKTLIITGALASGGFDGTKYTGDWDLFTFDVQKAGALDVRVEWTATAAVDVGLYDANLAQTGGDGTTAKPKNVKVATANGRMVVALFSKDNPTPYTLTVAYVQAGGGGGGGGGGGTCPTTPILPANHTGGCNIDVVNPVCEVADLRNGASYELDWTTHQSFCEGPHKIQISGDPPSNANSVFFSISSTYSGNDASMTRNIGGFMKITAKDLAPITSTSGVYYWGVAGFYGSSSEARAFTVQK